MQTTDKTLSRKNFIRLSAMTGAALTVGYYMPVLGKGVEKIITKDAADTLSMPLTSWISIDKSGKVTILNHRSEMGQGSFQAVPQMVAEELEVSLDQVTIAFAPGHQSKFGSQVTGGSSTVRGAYQRLLRTGATAREMLIETAAKRWNVNKADCFAENGFVVYKPDGKKIGYGDLVEEASKMEPPKNVKLKNRSEYKIIGKPLHRQDTPSKVNGTAEFGQDKKVKGMLYAMVERNPRFHGKVKSFDDSAARKIAGVKNVFKVQMPVFASTREGVVVVADTLWGAMQARKALKVEWDDSGFEHLSTDQLYARMRDDLKKTGLSQRTGGNPVAAFEKADKKVTAIYETPYESHSCMEPLSCIADVKDNVCEIWGPIQGPGWDQQDI